MLFLISTATRYLWFRKNIEYDLFDTNYAGTNLFFEDFLHSFSDRSTTPWPDQDVDVTNIGAGSQHILYEYLTNKTSGSGQKAVLAAVKFWNRWETTFNFSCHFLVIF